MAVVQPGVGETVDKNSAVNIFATPGGGGDQGGGGLFGGPSGR
ncbi:non-specific serine/threonine protein kinase OS=Streptomyces microflavus OX=1919 GN=Smic_39020 PE=4 SV=1 [Streptomyces microflavus]